MVILKKLSNDWKVISAKHSTLDPLKATLKSFMVKVRVRPVSTFKFLLSLFVFFTFPISFVSSINAENIAFYFICLFIPWNCRMRRD